MNTVGWVLDMAGQRDEQPLGEVADAILARFAAGASSPDEVPGLATLRNRLVRGSGSWELAQDLRALSHDGYLRGAVVALAAHLKIHPRIDIALVLARELMDALAPELGIDLARAVLALPRPEDESPDAPDPHTVANLLIGDTLVERGDLAGALRHFEAVLALDVDHARALRGWTTAVRGLEERGLPVRHRSRGLALLDGLEELELADGLGVDRYELRRPLGRGRHAVVYEAYDRRVGRDVAIKRLLADHARSDDLPGRVLDARFFAEARTLSRVRSPFVVAPLDVQPRHRFLALQLCRGGNLRLAMRRGLVTRDDLPQMGAQLRAALAAVHAAGAIHRDVKPANILVREARSGSPIALGDFGLAVGSGPANAPRAGTLRYLAPELRDTRVAASPASDRFSAGVVLLELALQPNPLPEAFDRIDGSFDAPALVPEDLPGEWTGTIRRLLGSDPEARTW